MSHTKTPWVLDGNTIVGSESVHTNGRERNKLGISSASYSDLVCEVHGWLELPHPRANAAFIVTACNAHEELVEAATAILQAFPQFERKEHTLGAKYTFAYWHRTAAMIETPLIAALQVALAKVKR